MGLPNLSSLTQGLRDTLARFPVPVLSAIIVTASLVWAVEFDYERDPIRRIALAALLYAGLALAIVSVDKLFNLKIDEEIYLQLWFVCAFAAHPLLFLGGIPQIRTLDENSSFPKPLRFSLRFIALPLVALYLLILYAYVGKMALQLSWPDGWVAMPIFILAVVGLLAFVLSLPLSKTETLGHTLPQMAFPCSHAPIGGALSGALSR